MNDEQPVSLQPLTVKLDDLVSAFEKLKSINSNYFQSVEDPAHRRRIDWLVARSAVASAGLVLFFTIATGLIGYSIKR